MIPQKVRKSLFCILGIKRFAKIGVGCPWRGAGGQFAQGEKVMKIKGIGDRCPARKNTESALFSRIAGDRVLLC